jgi:hypothetical protein
MRDLKRKYEEATTAERRRKIIEKMKRIDPWAEIPQ